MEYLIFRALQKYKRLRPVRFHMPGHKADRKRFPLFKDAAYDIMKGKGSTSYGIALAVSEVVAARAARDGRVLPLSVRARDAYGVGDMTLALPVSFGGNGVPGVAEIELGDDVRAQLAMTARGMREVYEQAEAE